MRMNMWNELIAGQIYEGIAGNLQYDPRSPLIFSSGFFLFLFAGFSTVYTLLKRTATLRLLFVTLFSYYFYYKSSGMYFGLLALVTLSDFLLALVIHRANGRALLAGAPVGEQGLLQKPVLARVAMGMSVAVDLGLLAYFKYTNFFAETWASLTGGTFTALDIFLPVGISFFTFQSLSYTIDVYRGRLRPLSNLLDYAFFVSFFPQLVAGPIVRASDFIPQIRKPLVITPDMFGRGVFLITIGLFKKAVISDYISVNFVERIFENPSLYSGVENLLGLYGYTLQIYCDFSGYSDMAIGLALLLGFRFPENFRSPYKAYSITDFWRRWHISLSGWLRDYLYISLGGNRKGRLRTYVNLMVTMLLGGLWHGASWNFVAWGALQGAGLTAHKAFRNFMGRGREHVSRGWRKFGAVVVTFHFVCFSWLLFRHRTFEGVGEMLQAIFTRFQPQVFVQWVEGYRMVAVLMLLGFVLHWLPDRWQTTCERTVVRMPLLLQAVVIVATVYLVIQVKSSEIQPFIYFQF